MLSSSLIALVAVSAPGLYPMRALQAASDLMIGRRTRFIIRLIVLFITLAITWVVVMLPMILIDMFFKQWEWAAGIPFVPVCLVVMTCFSGMYATAYLYLYYRWLLNS
jgi:flagellar biosynthesis protein FlhB